MSEKIFADLKEHYKLNCKNEEILFELIKLGCENIVIKLIDDNIFDLEYCYHKTGYTLLMQACIYNLPNVALKIIETGKSKPEQVTDRGNTALIYACINNMSDVALKLIETGKSKPEQVTDRGNTALIFACQNNMNDVALKLLETGKSNPKQIVNRYGEVYTALKFAYKHNMTYVISKIKEQIYPTYYVYEKNVHQLFLDFIDNKINVENFELIFYNLYHINIQRDMDKILSIPFMYEKISVGICEVLNKLI